MSLIFPRVDIARRWDGALDRRLRQSPLDEFLTSRHMGLAPSGPERISENLSRATIYLVNRICPEPDAAVVPADSIVADVACAVCHGLAEAIEEVSEWRVAALLSACHLLTPRWGKMSAATMAADSVQKYYVHYMEKAAHGDLDAISAAACQTLLIPESGAFSHPPRSHQSNAMAQASCRVIHVVPVRKQLAWDRRH
jgi:hypothetical protein